MSKADYLHDLILSLSKAEKRHFKLFASRYKKDSEKKYLSIFKTLERSGDSGYHLEWENESRSVATDKHYLSEMLLASLRQFHADSSVHMRLANELMSVELLRHKGLFRYALRRLLKAKKEALRYEIGEVVLQAIALEKEIRNASTTDWHDTLEDLTNEANIWLQNLSHLNTLNSKRIEQLRKAIVLGRPLTEEESAYWVERLNYFDPNKSLTGLLTEKFLRLRAFSHVCFVLHDMDRTEGLCVEMHDLYVKHPEFAEKCPQDYVQFLFRYVAISIETGNYKRAESLLQTVRQLRENRDNNPFLEAVNVIEEKLLSTEIFLHGKMGNYDYIRSKEGEVIEFMQTKTSSQQAVLGFNITVAFLFSGEWRKVIHWTHQGLIYPEVRKNYILFVALALHQILAHIELGDHETAIARLTSIKRYILQRSEGTTSVDVQIVNLLLRIICSRNPDEKRKHVAKFLDEYGSSAMFTQTSEYTGIRFWLRQFPGRRSLNLYFPNEEDHLLAR